MNTSESEFDRTAYNKIQPQVKNILTIRQNFGLCELQAHCHFAFLVDSSDGSGVMRSAANSHVKMAKVSQRVNDTSVRGLRS